MAYTDLTMLHISEDMDPGNGGLGGGNISHVLEDRGPVTREPKWFQQPVSSRFIVLLFCVCAGLIIVNIVVTASTRGSGGNERSVSAQDSDGSEGFNGQENGKDGSQHGLVSRNGAHRLPPDNVTGRGLLLLETYDGACPDDWSQFRNSCYYFSNMAKPWTESQRMCQRRKARLTVVNTQEEQVFLTKLAMKNRVWIGLSEINGEWKWVDGTPFSSTPKHWASGQPDEYFGHGLGGGEDCVQLYYSGDWNDEHCSRAYRYICEKKAVQ
ncbi:PREDICTED: hepatic lectin-like [Nanorana parkeri]|uniref:hepatic lectin-like n=1 Tax=Nanorana parkeri TaxID=125878 RepID=UPI000854D5B4|nr:PREDICTED: hepatic lectin-like [Nanorana parkeri]